MATTWQNLDMDVRRSILQKMNPGDRMLLWMSCNDDWSKLFSTSASRENPDHVAKLWSVRDAELERRLEACIERPVIAAAAARLGYRDKVFPLPGSFDADNWVASYAIASGDTELFRDIIAAFEHGGVDQGALWSSVIAKDDTQFTDLMLQLCIYPGLPETYRMIGLKLALKTARPLLAAHRSLTGFEFEMGGADNYDEDRNHGTLAYPYLMDEDTRIEMDPRPTLAMEMSTYGIREMLLGCVSAPVAAGDAAAEDVARTLFAELLQQLRFNYNVETEIIEAILNSPHPWNLAYLSHFPRTGDPYDDSEVLTYIARRAIETNNERAFAHLIEGAIWGDWELVDNLLWTACEFGTAEQVVALLEAGAPHSPLAYYYAALNEDANKGGRIIDALLQAGVPLEDEHFDSGLVAATLRNSAPLVRRFLDLGVAVTYHAMDVASSAEVYHMLIEALPLARRAEYADCAFYNAMGADAVDRVLLHLDVLGRAPTSTIYHQCLSMDAVNTFKHFWREGRYLADRFGLQSFEAGLAEHPELCKYVWENPREEVTVDWHAVIVHATVRRQKETLKTLEALYEERCGEEAWVDATAAVALRRHELHPPLPFQGFSELST